MIMYCDCCLVIIRIGHEEVWSLQNINMIFSDRIKVHKSLYAWAIQILYLIFQSNLNPVKIIIIHILDCEIKGGCVQSIM